MELTEKVLLAIIGLLSVVLPVWLDKRAQVRMKIIEDDTKDTREENEKMKADLASLQELEEESKKKIDSLELELRQYKQTVANLQVQVSEYQLIIKRKESIITDYKKANTKLKERVTSLEAKVNKHITETKEK